MSDAVELGAGWLCERCKASGFERNFNDALESAKRHRKNKCMGVGDVFYKIETTYGRKPVASIPEVSEEGAKKQSLLPKGSEL